MSAVGWLPPPAVPVLAGDEVHVWSVWLDARLDDAAGAASTLSEDELARAARFHFARERDRFVLARAVLRALLAGYLGGPPATVRFAYSETGKPRLAGGHAERLELAVAHSHGLALLAFARNRVIGVDVEPGDRRADHDAVARATFSAAENAYLASLPAGERKAAFFRLWTRKEAYLKATGVGLAGLGAAEVAIGADGEPRRSPAPVACDPRFSLVDLAPRAGFVAALVAEGAGWRPRELDLEPAWSGARPASARG